MTIAVERTLETPKTPEWVRCLHCGEIAFGKRYERLLQVCPGCGFHHRLSAQERLEQMMDPGSVATVEVPAVSDDPLRFTDTMPYRERLAAARERTGLDAAAICVRGAIGGHPVVAVVMDFRFMGGSLGVAVGERIVVAAETALRTRTPLIIVTASGGARMQEGTLALMQMARTSQALAALDEAGILTVTLVTDPTYGGVAASFASLTDVVLAEPGARMGFAGPRVIEQTIHRQLPDGFQTAEFLLEQGLIDGVQPRATLRPVLADLLAAAAPGTPQPASPGEAAVVHRADELPERAAWEVVQLARHIGRPTTLDYIGYLLEGFRELRGDRSSGDCRSIVGGLGRLRGLPVVLIGHQKGHDTNELVARNFGMPNPAGFRKAARLMRLAAKLGIPVVTLVDTPGAYPGLEAEMHGQAVAIAENLRLMSRLPVPVVTVITGEGGSGGALALAVADQVLALSNAVYSVISPEGCAAILWRDATAAPRAAEALRLQAREQLASGVIDAVVPEPEGGAHAQPAETAARVGGAVYAALLRLRELPPDELLAERGARYRRFGAEV
jgi:acetyl-CoA carboxylase carboxyl transferase alpha subunit/acetyl-CoA carboxylase carboxyl transferase beta subunit